MDNLDIITQAILENSELDEQEFSYIVDRLIELILQGAEDRAEFL